MTPEQTAGMLWPVKASERTPNLGEQVFIIIQVIPSLPAVMCSGKYIFSHQQEGYGFEINGVGLYLMDIFAKEIIWFEATPDHDDWILISPETMPSINKNVLIVERELNPDYPGTMAISRWNGEYDTYGKPHFDDDQDEQPGVYHPTHWMHLPAHPKRKQVPRSWQR